MANWKCVGCERKYTGAIAKKTKYDCYYCGIKLIKDVD